MLFHDATAHPNRETGKNIQITQQLQVISDKTQDMR